MDAYYPPNGPGGVTVKSLRFSKEHIHLIAAHGLRTEIAQAYGIIVNGMIMARHIFKGLKRGVCDGSEDNQGPNKLIYSWLPKFDYVWRGDPFTGKIEPVAAPQGKVFVVIVSPNSDINAENVGWIERWNWVDQDKEVKEAPIGFKHRYDGNIWTRPEPNVVNLVK